MLKSEGGGVTRGLSVVLTGGIGLAGVGARNRAGLAEEWPKFSQLSDSRGQ